jgi:hypothetical protein
MLRIKNIFPSKVFYNSQLYVIDIINAAFSLEKYSVN